MKIKKTRWVWENSEGKMYGTLCLETRVWMWEVPKTALWFLSWSFLGMSSIERQIWDRGQRSWLLFEHSFPRWLSSKESACQCRRHRRCRFNPWVRKIPWRRKWQLPWVLPGKFHGQRSLAGYRPWGRKESDIAKWLSMHWVLTCARHWLTFAWFTSVNFQNNFLSPTKVGRNWLV